MKSDRFNRKPILVKIPDGAEIKVCALHHSPEHILQSIPPQLIPSAIDVLQAALHLEDMVRAYNVERSKVHVNYVQTVREEWSATIRADRARKTEVEKGKIRKNEIRSLGKAEKVFLRKHGMTPSEFQKMLFDKMKAELFPKLGIE